jgi:hypothetical protein
MKILLAGLLAWPVLAYAAATQSTRSCPATNANDYPTAARADYVFACMNVNGGTQQALRQCSCSIDVIATIMPYQHYEQADTILRMRRLSGGYLAEEFRTAATNGVVRDLHEAQAEAEVRCF